MEKFLARQCKIYFLCLTELSGRDTPAATENQLATCKVFFIDGRFRAAILLPSICPG
jgi:hypothetical protein